MHKINRGSTKPIRMWIDGMCFNIKEHTKWKISSKTANKEKSESSSTLIPDDTFTINPTDDDKVSTKFRLPSKYYIRLNTFPNFTLKSLESETNTEILIPKHGNDGDITIKGIESNVIYAREVIQYVVSQIREMEGASQFISIPVHTEEVQRNFEKFKHEILSGDPITGMDETIFISSPKLHLTIAVFALLDSTEKDAAIATLNDCKTEVLSPLIEKHGPLKIKVAGIDCMNNNLQKVNILYAKAKIECENQEDFLQDVANRICDYFYKRGLVIQYQDNVKLHVTLLNTKYRKSSAEPSPKRYISRWSHKRQTFDARTIMEKYENYYFGESCLDSIHLSLMSSVGEDGYYQPLSIIKL